jgi:uncharacterized membrane protein
MTTDTVSSPRGSAHRLLLAGSALWLAALFAAPLARAEGWGIGELLYRFFAPVCHQLAERSAEVFGHPLAVCHRCSGLYAGFLAALCAWPLFPAMRRALLARPRLALLAAVPLLVDVAFFADVPMIRFLTGFVAAWPVALFSWVALEQILEDLAPQAAASH